jgi:hypothetical protein
MICCISQPRFFPGLHYLHRMMVSDVWIVLDTALFNREQEEHRCRIRTPSGSQRHADYRWMTVPIKRPRAGLELLPVEADDTQPWRRNMLDLLRATYGTATHFRETFPEVESAIMRSGAYLVGLDIDSWGPAAKRLPLDCEFRFASSYRGTGGWTDGLTGSARLVELCQLAGCETYLSGPLGRDYLDVAAFKAAGIEVRYHDYQYPPLEDGSRSPFYSYLDALFRRGLTPELVEEGALPQEVARA